ncbi:MAG: type II toxin-antitoxin system RelE/ParE family toxin [Leptospirales bacterium]
MQNKKHVYRIFLAFEPRKTGVLLIAGDKCGNKRFYEKMIPIADALRMVFMRLSHTSSRI